MNTPQLFKNLYNLEKQPTKTYNYNIKNFKIFLKNFNNPQNRMGKIIHIAGTNGKGSVAKILSDSLILSGYKVGLYTSPHLYEINERIMINNKPISDYMFKKYEKEIYKEIKKKKKDYRTFFEAMTTMAFMFFADKNVDYSIIETGLGGRLDSTNIIMPFLTIITKIDLDHTKILGNTLEKITKEKCGIIKKNIPVFTFTQKSIVINTIKKYAKKNNSDLFITNINNIKVKNNHMFLYKNNIYKIKKPMFYQKINSALCIDVLKYLNIEQKIIKNAINNFSIPGRMEVIKNNPLTIIDVSHNPSAIETTLKEIKSIYKNKHIFIIAISMKDKNINLIIKIMQKFSNEIVFTTIPFFRAAKKKDLSNIKNIIFKNNFSQAYKYFLNNKSNNSILLIIGSFYFIKYVKRIIN